MLEAYRDVLDIKELCEILRISRKTAYQLLHSGAIPCRKIGRNYKIRKDMVEEYLSNK